MRAPAESKDPYRTNELFRLEESGGVSNEQVEGNRGASALRMTAANTRCYGPFGSAQDDTPARSGRYHTLQAFTGIMGCPALQPKA